MSTTNNQIMSRNSCSRLSILTRKMFHLSGSCSSCGSAPRIQNGYSNSSQASHPCGSVVSYTCYSQFNMFGNSRITCNNGRWEDAPSCRTGMENVTKAMLGRYACFFLPLTDKIMEEFCDCESYHNDVQDKCPSGEGIPVT